MSSKPLFAAALVALSLGLVACGDSGSDSSTTEAETTPSAQESSPPAQEDEGAQPGDEENEIVPEGEEGEGAADESEPAPSGEAAKAEKVEIAEFTYQTNPVVVQVGGKVTWQNEDTAPHTATADDKSFDTGTLDKGKIGSATFKEAGTFGYFCEIHPTMKGIVEVVE
ncbi:MAG TPA: cupredoxin family copper-binding protein [Solirubrobacterales bacterium]|jgi:plastocyanin|nr:cupredoxin family copper-binding protein [Solirubrobacterales bacterium]